MSELAQVTIEISGGVALARLRGEIDLSNAEDVLELILEGAVSQPGPGLVVDLSHNPLHRQRGHQGALRAPRTTRRTRKARSGRRP